MIKLPLAVALLVVSSSAAGQNNVLVPVERTPIVGADERSFSVMFPIACDEQGRTYVRLSRVEAGIDDPLLRISNKGSVDVQFGTSGEVLNRYAIRHDGGVIMYHSDGKDKFLDNFGSDGARESSVRLEVPPTAFFPSQLAIFQSGEIFMAGQQYRPSYKASAAIYSPSGLLIKQPVLDEDEKREQEIVSDSGAQKLNAQAIDKSVATAGDDGLVYLMRPTNPAVVYGISRSGEMLRTLQVPAPAGAGDPWFGLRVVKNRLVIQYRRDCGPAVRACVGSIFTVLDATSGKTLAVYQADAKEVSGLLTCYAPDPDRFFLLSLSPQARRWEIVEARGKESSP